MLFVERQGGVRGEVRGLHDFLKNLRSRVVVVCKYILNFMFIEREKMTNKPLEAKDTKVCINPDCRKKITSESAVCPHCRTPQGPLIR